jgi:hypothetical protein
MRQEFKYNNLYINNAVMTKKLETFTRTKVTNMFRLSSNCNDKDCFMDHSCESLYNEPTVFAR